jgi:CRISPR-associated protein Cas4
MNDKLGFVEKLLEDLSKIPTDLILLAVIVVAAIIMIDAFQSVIAVKGQEAGLGTKSKPIAIDGSEVTTAKQYISESQGLAGRPDALISEDGFIIPVERKPFAKKIRDRYVAQILVYLRLVEEFEGKKPPYGYLVLGPKCKQVKIENTEARQQWLTKILEEMRTTLATNEAKPAPSPRKCPKCEVNKFCKFVR